MYLNIYKIGGNVIDDPQKLETFPDMFCHARERKYWYGGGKLASELCQQLGIKVQMEEGRRITDSMTLRVAVMVYAGWINKNLVSSLISRDALPGPERC